MFQPFSSDDMFAQIVAICDERTNVRDGYQYDVDAVFFDLFDHRGVIDLARLSTEEIESLLARHNECDVNNWSDAQYDDAMQYQGVA